MNVKTAHTRAPDAAKAVAELRAQLPGKVKALIVFASPSYDLAGLFSGLKRSIGADFLIGCSSAGEFSEGGFAERAVSAMAISGPDLVVQAAHAAAISANRDAAGTRLAELIATPDILEQPHKVALVLADALSGYTEVLVAAMQRSVGPTWRFFGGGAGDDARFQKTFVVFGDHVHEDAAVALAIGSSKPIGLSFRHDWVPSGSLMRATSSQGVVLKTLDGAPAVEAVEAFARQTQQKFDSASPVGFFLHNVIGVKTPGGFKLRVPLAVGADGSLQCASDVPEGSIVSFMRPPLTAGAAAQAAALEALGQLEGNPPEAALLFDCAATRLRLGTGFSAELKLFGEVLQAPYAGCNTYGQIAPGSNSLADFHNCTAVVCVFPK